MINGIDCPYCGGRMENLDEVRGHHLCDTCGYERDCDGDITVPEECGENVGSTSTYWARCNYNINTGENEPEPEGTATSMHECGNCEVFEQCIIKSENEVWEFNSGIKELIEKELERMAR